MWRGLVDLGLCRERWLGVAKSERSVVVCGGVGWWQAVGGRASW